VVVWSSSSTSVPRPQQVTICTSASDLENTPAVHIECNLDFPIKIIMASLYDRKVAIRINIGFNPVIWVWLTYN